MLLLSQVGVSMTHLLTPEFGSIVQEGGSLVLETPLFLLQVGRVVLIAEV